MTMTIESRGRAVLLAAMLLAACGPKTPPRTAPSTDTGKPMTEKATGLAGTIWQWTGTKSPSGQVTPDDPAKYTISFAKDGKASLQADCNRGATSYTSAAPGELTFTPIALTRAMCPPGSKSDAYARDVGNVVSYRIVGSQLFMDLPSGGGTLQFTRAQ